MRPVHVLWIARYDYRPGWSLRPHRHDHLQMILFLDGQGTLRIGRRTLPVNGGEWCLIRTGETHSFRAETLVRTLDVKFRLPEGPLRRLLRRAAIVLAGNEPGIAARLERIRIEGEKKRPFYRELCGSLLTEILYLYLRKEQGDRESFDPPPVERISAHDTVLDRALACIRDRHIEPLTVREIARAAGCTDRTLRLHFRSAMNMAPLAYLQNHRLARAKALIQYSDTALKEIARQVGFRTVHHFTRHFTASEGRGPAVWRKRYLDGIRKDVYIDPKFENRVFTVDVKGSRP